jgi:hypothetical protein
VWHRELAVANSPGCVTVDPACSSDSVTGDGADSSEGFAEVVVVGVGGVLGTLDCLTSCQRAREIPK